MENLAHLMAAYFHQDWWEEYDGSWPAAVKDFARRAPDRVPATIEEITAILDRSPTDAEVAKILDDLGNYRSPGRDPDAHIDWLEDIKSILSGVARSETRMA